MARTLWCLPEDGHSLAAPDSMIHRDPAPTPAWLCKLTLTDALPNERENA